MADDRTSQPPTGQRKNWVKFDEDNVPATETITSSKVDGHPLPPEDDNSSAAVLPVENGPHSTNVPSHPSTDTYNGAVIDTTQVHVTLDRMQRPPDPLSMNVPHPKPAPRTVPPSAVHRSVSSPSGAAALSAVPVPPSRPETTIEVGKLPSVSTQPAAPQRPLGPHPSRLHNIPLQDINGHRGSAPRQDSFNLRQGFANGDVIVSLFPVNEKCPWLTRATFRPELVPEELMAEGLTLTVEEYVAALELLVNDVRFNCYNMCYKRILLFWILFGFIVLLALLFSGQRGIGLFGGGVVWLFLNATGIFVCMWLKIKMSHHLERCLASVNKYLWKHKILLGLDDKGKLSCHKVNLIFVYFDCTDCVRKLNEVIDLYDREPKEDKQRRGQPNIQTRMDINDSDIIITGSTTTRVSRKQERAEKLLLRYSQRWVKEYSRHRLDLTVDVHDRAEGEPPAAPRHCVQARCPCQYIEEHLKYKPRGCEACFDAASIPVLLAPSYM